MSRPTHASCLDGFCPAGASSVGNAFEIDGDLLLIDVVRVVGAAIPIACSFALLALVCWHAASLTGTLMGLAQALRRSCTDKLQKHPLRQPAASAFSGSLISNCLIASLIACSLSSASPMNSAGVARIREMRWSLGFNAEPQSKLRPPGVNPDRQRWRMGRLDDRPRQGCSCTKLPRRNPVSGGLFVMPPVY